MNKKGNKIPQINSCEDLMKIKQDEFFRDLRELRKYIKLWRDIKVDIKKQTGDASVLLQYAIYLEEANNIDRAKSNFFIKPLIYDKDVQNIETQKQIFLGSKFLDQKDWKVDFSLSFIENLKKISEKSIIELFIKLYILAEGYLIFKKGKELSLQPWEVQTNMNLKLFKLPIDINGKNHFLLLTIGVQKFIHFDFGNNQKQIKGFDYFLVIRCEQIISQESCYNQKLVRTLLERIETEIEENPRLKYKKHQLKIDQQSIKPKQLYYHLKKGDNYDKPTILTPTPFQIYVPKDPIQIDEMEFTLTKYFQFRNRISYKRLNTKQIKLNCEEQDQDQNIQVSYDQLRIQTEKNQVVQFNGHSKILENLKKIPNFKYQLVSQQRQVLCKEGNLIIVGRSGTGKTTCAMLRLYGIQFMIKTKEYNSLKKQNLIDPKQKCLIMFQQANQFTKNIFLTFSHVLIDEIKKQYEDMIYQIKQKHADKCQMCQKTLKINRREQQQDPLDRLKRQEEQQQKRVISLNEIRSNDYPGFFTVEKFIRIIDKTIKRPFFCHDKNKQGNGKNIIKKSFINKYHYGPQKIVNTDTIQCTYVDYDFFFNHIWSDLPKQLTKASKQFCLLTPSIIWSEIFSIMKGSLKSHSCPEGFISLKMYLQDHMSIFQRQQQKVRQYKQRAYKIMKSYINWCRIQNAYDLMDVVNHILKQIQFYEYPGPKIHYMFIDQVQDLTASTTFLISKMVINNVFYCGDTAQAITKGVSFRFQDLKFLFNREYCKNALTLQPPEGIINLTVNFRSHNFILQLANSIVATIEGIFPKSINKMKEQKSNLCGPRPYLILKQHYSILFDLLCGASLEDEEQEQKQIDLEQSLSQVVKLQERKIFRKAERKKKKLQRAQKKQLQEDNEENQMMNNEESDDQYIEKRQFNSEQVIIVRNLQQKKKLPKNLRKGIVLTPESAKGLQYDCVILYNFFGSCPIYQKWGSILEHLESYHNLQTIKQFQKDITRRQKQQGEQKQEKPLPMETKILLGFDKDKDMYKVWNIRVKQSIKGVSVNLFHELATELKILYTVITRARSVFVIYDKRIPNQFYKLWRQMMLVEQSNWDNVEEQHKVVKDYVQVKQKHKKYINDDAKWFQQGSNMLARKDFDNAKKCFLNIKRFDIVQRIQAYQIQIKAQNQLYRIQTNQKNLLRYGRDDRKIAKIRLQKQKKIVLLQYTQAGKKYLKHKRFKEASQAFQKGLNFQQALKCYRQVNNPQKIAYCCKRLKRYNEAIEIFKEYNDIEGLIDCYIQLKSWPKLFQLLTKNSINIESIEGINDISITCVNQMLSSLIKSEKIQNAIQYFNNFYGIQFQGQRHKKRVYNQLELSLQVGKVFLEYQYIFMKKLLSKLTLKAKNFQDVQESHNSLQAKIGVLIDQQSKLDIKISQVKHQQDKIVDNLQDCLQQILFYEQKYDEQQLLKMPNYLNKQKQKVQHSRYLVEINNQLSYAKVQLQILQAELQQLQPEFKKVQIQYKNLCKTYSHKFITSGIQFINRKLKITMSNFITLMKSPKHDSNQKTKKSQPANEIQQNDMLSMSDFSQMTQMWQCQEGKIGGLRLMPNDSQYLMGQVQMIIGLSQKILNLQVQQTYKPYHHRFIHQKLMKFLVESVSSQQYYTVQTLRKCDLVEQYIICLAVCNYKPEFVCLAPKYISGYCLNYSNNFKQSRHFKEELEQLIEEAQDNNGEDQEEDEAEQQKQTQVQKFILTLKQEGLQHKIPRLSFINRYYYETLASQVIYSLLLQGFYKQALILCNPNTGCKLAYMYSSYKKLVKYIKQIAVKLGIRKLLDKQFLFTEDERILNYYPQAKVVNIFSMQNIVYAYDQCQSNPFLSKKRTTEDIIIASHLFEHYYDVQSHKEIEKAEKQMINTYDQIAKIQNLNRYYEQCKKSQIFDKEVADRSYNQSIREWQANIKKQQNQISILQMEQKQLNNKYSNLLLIYNQSKLSHAQKKSYENQSQQLLFYIQQLQSQKNEHEVQRLKRRRMDLDEQYKQKRRNQLQSFENFQKIKMRIQMKERQIKSKRQTIRKSFDYIKYQRQKIQQMTPQMISRQYVKHIGQNNKNIKLLKNSIPEWLKIQNKTERIQAVVRELINKQKNIILEDSLSKMREQNMNNIKRSSNIPIGNQNYKFLSLYISDSFTNKNTGNNKQYQQMIITVFKIFRISASLQKMLQQQKSLLQNSINDLKICSLVIMYLSILFNRSFRQAIDELIQRQTYISQQNRQELSQIQQDLRRVNNQIQFSNNKLYQLRQIQGIKDKRHPKNRDLNNFTYQLNLSQAKKVQLLQMQGEKMPVSLNPSKQYQDFLNSIYTKIKNLDSSQIRFLDILFGFYQCRVIRQCAPLGFLQSEYVLAKSNSIVIQHLKKQNPRCFAYRFDQENETILCRFEDIQKIILGIIEKRHQQIYNVNPNLNQKDIRNKDKRKYMDRQTLGFKKNSQLDERQNQTILDLTITDLTWDKKEKVRRIYDSNFKSPQFMIQVKAAKKEALEYLLGQKHTRSQDFFFASHQIREYYFVEKTLFKMNNFNYDLLHELQEKFQELRKEWQNYFRVQPLKGKNNA